MQDFFYFYIMTPKEIIIKWVDAFNKKDVETLVNFYHDDAINHQVNATALHGKVAIQNMFEEEFAKAEMVCIVENIFEEGNWGMLEWSDPLGLKGCGFFEFENNKIKFQRGYWDKLSFLRIHGLPLPKE